MRQDPSLEAILIETIMFVLAVLTLGMHVALPTALYLQRVLVLLIDVRACCDFAVDFIGKKAVYVVVIFISTLPVMIGAKLRLHQIF